MSALEDAAREYVAARVDNETIAAPDWETGLARVDNAWHELLIACGYPDELFDVDLLPSTVAAEPTADIGTIDQEIDA